MYALTKDGRFENGVYAILGPDSVTTVQFFVNEDDAIRYSIHLEAIGTELMVTKVDGDKVDRMCELMGYAHTIIEPGHLVVPRAETLQTELGL
jgi:hypothetical protein